MSNSSFQFANPSQIKRAKEVLHLDHVAVCRGYTGVSGRRGLHKGGCESWCCAWAPDHSFLAWSAGHRMIHLIPWDAKQPKKHDPNDTQGLGGRQYHIIDCGEIVHSMVFGHSSNRIHKQRWKRQRCDITSLVLASGHPSGRIKLWNCETGALLLEIMDHKDIVHDLHFTHDGTLGLASASRDGSVKLWEFDEQGDCNLYLTIKTNTNHAFCCRWSPNRNYVAVVGSIKMALLFVLEDRKVKSRLRLEGHHHDVVNCDFSPDGALLATASYDSRIIIWDVDNRTQIAELGHLYPKPGLIYAGGANDHYVYSVKFSPEGTRLASVGDDGYVRVWQLPDMSDPVTIAAVDGGRCCSFSSDGQLLTVGTSAGSLCVLATPRGGVCSLMHMCRSVVRSLVTTPDIPALPLPRGLHKYLAYKENSSDDSLAAGKN
ncbi:WD repeat and SOCS box-containing protein 1-like isoform X1 [Littorina saxatilis]